MPRILIIDDEKAIRHTLKEILEFEDYQVDQAEDGPAGLDLLIQQKYDVVLCDIKMPKMDGLEVLERARTLAPDATFIMVSAHGNIETAVERHQEGRVRLHCQAARPQPPARDGAQRAGAHQVDLRNQDAQEEARRHQGQRDDWRLRRAGGGAQGH
ncbi:MAG: response regulator [Hymenobacter sp.]